MRIERLTIHNLRVLESVALSLTDGIHLFTGDNGAGKTTLLEAIVLLGRGRSFRHADAGPLIREGCDAAEIFARIRTAQGVGHAVGLRRAPRRFEARIDGQEVKRRSELVRLLPMQWLVPGSHEVVEGGPEVRRRFLDEGVFHVEPSYHQRLENYVKALRQRNAALARNDPRLAQAFEPELAHAGEALTESRARYVRSLESQVKALLVELGAGFQVEIGFHPGWSEGALRVLLARNRNRELTRGYTFGGPHRADLKLTCRGRPASRVLSRGQQKLLVYALGLARWALTTAARSDPPLLLIDDLGAEFDDRKAEALMAWIAERPVQAWVTSVKPGAWTKYCAQMFHVEQGRVAAIGESTSG